MYQKLQEPDGRRIVKPVWINVCIQQVRKPQPLHCYGGDIVPNNYTDDSQNDNASGMAGTLEAARYSRSINLKVVLFMGLAGEEQGYGGKGLATMPRKRLGNYGILNNDMLEIFRRCRWCYNNRSLEFFRTRA